MTSLRLTLDVYCFTCHHVLWVVNDCTHLNEWAKIERIKDMRNFTRPGGPGDMTDLLEPVDAVLSWAMGVPPISSPALGRAAQMHMDAGTQPRASSESPVRSAHRLPARQDCKDVGRRGDTERHNHSTDGRLGLRPSLKSPAQSVLRNQRSGTRRKSIEWRDATRGMSLKDTRMYECDSYLAHLDLAHHEDSGRTLFGSTASPGAPRTGLLSPGETPLWRLPGADNHIAQAVSDPPVNTMRLLDGRSARDRGRAGHLLQNLREEDVVEIVF